MLAPEQISQIKEQLFSQLEQTDLPNKQEIQDSIKTMNAEQLEQFLVKNKLIKQSGDQQCIFCSIIEEKIPSYKIGENEQAIAILEINPISKGHAIIIPKIHGSETPKQALDLAEETSKKISKIFNPKKVDIIPTNLFGHEILNILPVYKNETIHSEKKQASEQKLKEMQKQILETKQEAKEIKEKEKPKKKEIISDKTHWLPRRIP